MFWKILGIISKIFTFSNVLYIFLFIVLFILIIALFLQKNSEDFSEQKNLFGPNVRAETPVTITYYLIAIFVFLILILNITQQKEYNKVALSKGEKIIKKIKKVSKKDSTKNYKIKRIIKFSKKI